MDLDARLCAEVADVIDKKQIDLLNVVVDKLLEKLRGKESTLKSLVFSLIPCLLLYSLLNRTILP